VETEFLVASAELVQAALGVVDLLYPILRSLESVSQRVLERSKPRIQLHYTRTVIRYGAGCATDHRVV
jgi:hypothetical protein